MNKPFLLMCGHTYYPSHGTGDWKGRFASYEEAESKIKKIEHPSYFLSGKRKGEIKDTFTTYEYEGNRYDWYEIENLEQYNYDNT